MVAKADLKNFRDIGVVFLVMVVPFATRTDHEERGL